MLAKLLFSIFLLECIARSSGQFAYHLSDQDGFHLVNVLTNVVTPSSYQFVDPNDQTTYLLQSTNNRSLNLVVYFQQANRTSDDRPVNKSLLFQLAQDLHKPTLQTLTLKFDALQVPIVQSEKFDLDPARSTLRIPFNSSLNLLVYLQNSDRSTNDHRSFHFVVNPVDFDHRLQMIFENVNASEFRKKQSAIADLFDTPGLEDRFTKLLSWEQHGRDLQVVFAGFPNFNNLILNDLLINSCAEKNGQMNETKHEMDVRPLIKSFDEAFGLKLKECSVKLQSVQAPVQELKSAEVWFGLVRSDSSSHSIQPSARPPIIVMLLLLSLLSPLISVLLV